MNCTACSKPNLDDVLFCEFCGTNLRTLSAPIAGIAAPGPARAQAAPPSAAEVAQMGKSILSALTLGEKIAAAGAIAATLGFFLPLISAPDLGSLGALSGLFGQGASEISHASYSLFDLAKFLGAIYFVLLAAIGSGVLFYFSRKATYAPKMLINGFQVMIGSIFGPGNIVILLFVPMVQSVAGLGYWLTGLGFCSIAAGGLITIAQSAKTAR